MLNGTSTPCPVSSAPGSSTVASGSDIAHSTTASASVWDASRAVMQMALAACRVPAFRYTATIRARDAVADAAAIAPVLPSYHDLSLTARSAALEAAVALDRLPTMTIGFAAVACAIRAAPSAVSVL